LNSLKNYRLEILLFLCVWLAYGLTINSRNLEGFNLQQMGVEAIVERGAFYVEGSRSPKLQPLGDVFVYKEHKYAAKQPGQFMAGALCYFVLHLFGLDYVTNYLMTSALVTFFTASLVCALAAVLLYRLARAICKEGSSRFWPLGAALSFALATTVFPYAGIAHHDAIASGFVLMAFACAFHLSRAGEKGRATHLLALGAGLFLGLTVTTSMLAFWPAVAVFLYFLSLGRWRLVHYFLLGGVVGLAPLFIYDAVNFGNPFLLPNVAGNYSDTFFRLDFNNFTDKVGFYLKWTMAYAPVLLIGLAGLSLLPSRLFRREKLAAAGAVGFLCAYIFNIDTVGTCQYGPRYLLPVMAFGCLGLAGFSYLESRGARKVWAVLIATVGLLSFMVNAVGAMQGAMYCDLARHAFWPHVASLRRGDWPTFPLFPWLFIPTVLCLYSFVKLVMVNEARPKELSTTARRSKSSR
jgi:MFS family permease